MKEATGDLWLLQGDARCITTNGTITKTAAGVMGRGVALQATAIYPGVKNDLGKYLRQYGNHTGVLIEDAIPLVVLPVKHHWSEKADIELIKRSLDELVALTEARGWQTVLLPRPGCGNGRLRWEGVVEKLCRARLDDRFTVVWKGTDWDGRHDADPVKERP